jgi:hypothetical protein
MRRQLYSLLSWLLPHHYLRRKTHNVTVDHTVELPVIDEPHVRPEARDGERQHFDEVLTENEKRLAALRAYVNAQRRGR